ncbi:MAG: tol-pal system protein YbgF, partial [Halieaceae bacterium]|nr:tol-pal system protein YbgF [Halieaceae bacterium]
RAAAGTDPYGTQPSAAYPTTSYGVNSAAASPATRTMSTATSPQQSQGRNLASLFSQIQQLQQEVMMLNGKVEEQAHELRQLKQQSLERYVDLDRRLGAASTVATPGDGTLSHDNTIQVATRVPGSEPAVVEQAGEGEAYQAAYGLVRGQQFDEAVVGFNQFLENYPAGKYSPNAHYWLGELYLVVQPMQLESSRQAFMLLLSQYPDNSKVPDTLFKLGKVHFMKGNRERSREFLDRLISDYGSTNATAVKLAQDFIRDNY